MRNQWISGLLIAAALMGCGGGGGGTEPTNGPVKPGVVAGNYQSVTAQRQAALPTRPIVLAVQLANGQVALRRVDDSPWQRALDLVVPRAWAQTQVQGVPNFPVCTAQPKPGERVLKAEIPCTNTDATGRAYLTMLHDSIAGTAIARIGYAGTSGTVITDSVVATVLPGAVDSSYRSDGLIQQKGDTVRRGAVRDKFGNAIAYRIVSDSLITVPGTVAGTEDARRISFTTPAVSKLDRPGTIVDANGNLIARMRYQLYYDGRFSVSIAGLNATP